MPNVELTDGRTLETIATMEELRSVVGEPGSLAVRKDIARIDDNFAGYIQKSPFALLGTASADGLCDVSPRGDKPGFAKVLDETHVALPERPGNKRADSLSNIVATGRAGLLFLIPGSGHTLRVNGAAHLTKDAALLELMAVDGKPAVVAIVVTVQEAYIHCPKAFLRSQLWDTNSWPADPPSMACIVQDQLSLEHVPLETIVATLAEDNKHLW